MENNMMYVVLNGDGTGATLGSAISNNDIESLQSAQGSINEAHNKIEQWVQENGGQIISSSGDESIFSLPRDYAVHLDKLLSFYQNTSQHDATIGIGNSISEAVKAIVYGKNNNRSAINEYSPEMESDSSDQELPEQDMGSEQAPEMDSEEVPVEEDSQEQIQNEQQVPEHEQDLSPEEKEIHDSTENMSDAEEIEQEQQADKMDNIEGGDEDSEQSQDNEDGELTEEDIQSQEEPQEIEEDQEEGQEEENPNLTNVLQSHLNEEGDDEQDNGMYEEDSKEESPEMGEEIPQEEGSEEIITEENPEIPQEEGSEEIITEENPDDSINHDPVVEEQEGVDNNPDQMVNLKNEIGNALEQFQMNKETLESHKDSNPELYSAMLTMVGAMIHMSKMLGLDSSSDIQSEEGVVNSSPIMEEDSQDFPQGK